MGDRTDGRHYRAMRVASLLVAGTLLIAACGDDKQDAVSGSEASPGNPKSDESSGAASNDLRAALGERHDAEGSVVRIGFPSNEGGTAVNLPEIREAAQAATHYANEHLGGIAGHPIELVICEDHGDGATATACANRFVQAGVAAVVASQLPNPDLYLPVLESAGIPWIAAVGTGRLENSSADSFLWTGGTPAILAALAQYWVDEGKKHVVAIIVDVPGLTGFMGTVGQKLFSDAGIQLDVVAIPPGTADPTPQIAAGLSRNPDAISVFVDPTLCRALLPPLRDANVQDLPVTIGDTCMGADVLDAIAGAAEGLTVSSASGATDDSEEGTLYRAVMTEYAPETSFTGKAAAGYVGLLGLVRAVNSVGIEGEPTGAAVANALRSAREVPLPGFPGATFTCDGKALPSFPAVCSANVLVAKVSGNGLTDFRVIDAAGLVN